MGEDGEQIGIKSTDEAREYAYSKGLDLVEVAAGADPPVARVMDYGKYRYEQEQKAKLARKHQTQINVKEIKFRAEDRHSRLRDEEGPRRALSQPAREGQGHDHVRGRENLHLERGRDLLLRLADEIKELGVVESPPLLDGRNMVMLLGPTKNAGVKPDAKDEERERSEEALQGDGDGKDPAPARDEPQPGAQVGQASAPSARTTRSPRWTRRA